MHEAVADLVRQDKIHRVRLARRLDRVVLARRGLLPVPRRLQEREGNKTFEVIEQQVAKGLEGVQGNVVLAYEPVWAIGTGVVATPEQAQEVHAFIRGKLVEILGKDQADKTVIQYGGSVKPDNAKILLSQKDIDGALIGGAALKADSFVSIIKTASEL